MDEQLHKSEKRHKKDKAERKRARDGDEGDAFRKHKKHRRRDDSNGHGDDGANAENGDMSPNAQLAMESHDVQRKEKKHKKSKKPRPEELVPIIPDHTPIDTAPGMTEDTTALRTAGITDLAAEEPFVEPTEPAQKKKKSRTHKHLDDYATSATERAEESVYAIRTAQADGEKKKKKKKRHHDHPEDSKVDVSETARQTEDERTERRKSKSKSKRREKHTTVESTAVDAMDLDGYDFHLQPANAPAKPKFPFFTQKVYLYLPLYPAGFAAPISSIAKQHLEPLVNHYSPMLRGVVLGYSNVSLAHRPAARKTPQTDDTPAILESIDEYAVGFGWLTVDVSLFVPTRGAWMEGCVNLQNEGHIGVLCWEKFSASIDAKRLPPGWKWIDYLSGDSEASHGAAGQDEGVQQDTVAEDNQSLHQMHATGYWVDASGKPVKGSMLFRIRDFEIGRVGDHGYLSIVGTMLTEEEEKTLEAEERVEQTRRRRKLNPAGLLRAETRRVPEFSITTFGKEDQEETGAERLVFSRSRLNTPDD